jgi:DNA-binding transcriptional LysR family regulator
VDLLQSVKTFLQVVESGSFAEAARRLDCSCAAVSRQVAFLETTVGGRLLNRTTRKLGLTEVGQACFERYSRIVAEIDEVQQVAQAGTVAPQGTLRVTSVLLFWIWRVAPVLPEFLARYPKLRVQVSLVERAVDLVEEGYDVALQFIPPHAKALVGRRIAPLPRVLYASADYLRKRGWPSQPDDLRGHNCLLYAHYAEEVEWEFRSENGTLGVKVDGNLRSNDAITVRLAAIQGMGIARGPVFLVHADLECGKLVRVLSDYEVTSLDLWAIHPSGRQLPAKVSVFIDFLEEKFGRDRTLAAPLRRQGRRRSRGRRIESGLPSE